MGCLVCNLINATVIENPDMPKMPEDYPTPEQEVQIRDLENELCSDIVTRHPEMVAKILSFFVIHVYARMDSLKEEIDEETKNKD